MKRYVFSIVDILPYFIVLFFLMIILIQKYNPKKKAFLSFILILLFASVRYGIGWDYFSYLSAITHEGSDLLDRYEPLSRLLADIAYYTHYQVFFALGSFLTLFPIYKIVSKYSVNPALSIIIYYLFPLFYLDCLGIVRNAIAYSMVFGGFFCLLEKKRFYAISLFVIGCLFHKSAAIFVVYYIVRYLKIGFVTNFIIFLSSFLLFAVISKIVDSYAAQIALLSDAKRYLEDSSEGGGSMMIIVNALALINFILWKRLEVLNTRMSIYLTVFNIGVVIFNIFCGADVFLSFRLSSFFLIIIIIISPYYGYAVKSSYKIMVQRINLLFWVTLFISHFYINVSAFLKSPSRASSFPYQTIFNHEDYYNIQ